MIDKPRAAMDYLSPNGDCAAAIAAAKSNPKGREMIRNLKTLGLALVAVFAFSALAASAASAQNQGTLTSTGPVTLTGNETGTLFANALTGPLGDVTCPGSTYTGHAVLTHAQTTAGTKHGLITVPATTVTITPFYATKCQAHIPIFGTRPATVTMNGCDYEFHLGVTTGGGETYGVTADLKCPTGKLAEVHIYKTGSVTHPDADSVCTIKFGETNNQGIAGAHVVNTAGGTLGINGKAENIHTESTGSLCGTSTSETADLDVDVTIKGDNSLGEPTAISVTDP
ncbi:MAG: hypothetical protein WA687_06310 [Solirubrobacterales bacterium]